MVPGATHSVSRRRQRQVAASDERPADGDRDVSQSWRDQSTAALAAGHH
jgi:hypothetical protein